MDALLRGLVRLLLGLRYRVRVTGIDEVAARGRSGILFLANHPAMIDPIILGVSLNRRFGARFLAYEDQIDRFFIRTLARRVRAITMPDLSRTGAAGREESTAAVERCVESLTTGDNLVLYPAGRLMRSRYEDLRAGSAVQTILQRLPDVRVVLVCTRGLWGSRFGFAWGHAPKLGDVLRESLGCLLLSGLVFMPRRRVTIELREPPDLPRHADRDTVNRYLEAFYNTGAPPNTFVPYTPWQGFEPRPQPEPPRQIMAGDLADVPEATREQVHEYLSDLTGMSRIRDDDRLAHELGMDSLATVDLLTWLAKEFGFPPGDIEHVRTVRDVLLAACGQGVAAGSTTVKPPTAKWFAAGEGEPEVLVPAGDNIAGVFLEQARRHPGQAIVADQTSGVKTYRDLVTSIFALRPVVASCSGSYVGIMLPASVAADVCYLATMFAGKIPVMVNWTVGSRNVKHGLDVVGAEKVLTAKALVDRLAEQGVELGAVADRFVYLETVGASLPRRAKLKAWVCSHFNWQSLRSAPIADTAVVLFTSGSESLPKAVPLSHRNLLTNVRDLTTFIDLRGTDRLLGILPPFHSFGLTVGVVTCLCTGIPVVHHANPTEAPMLARLAEAYRATLLIGTPTFLGSIARSADPGQLDSLRLLVTGAEKCPDRVYDQLARGCPEATILEGYGITECSPAVAVTPPDNPQRGTIGVVLPSVEHAIVEIDISRRTTTGRAGMLLLRGPSVFDGYLGHDGPTPFVEFEGKQWYLTGDLVSADADGLLRFAGRLKRFVKLGGEMISLPAVEGVLGSQYEGSEADGPVLAVGSANDDEHPELVLFTTLPLDRETVNSKIRQAGLSPLHNIRRVVRVDSIPLLGSGKIDYRTLQSGLS